MKITDLFRDKVRVLTSEVGPVKGCVRDTDNGHRPKCLDEANLVKDFVHAVNVTDNQSAVMRLGSLAGSVKLKEQGIEPIYQITCRDRNRIALQSEVLTACSLGIDNVLILTGDHTSLGDHIAAKPVFDVDSVQLLKIASGMKAVKPAEVKQLLRSNVRLNEQGSVEVINEDNKMVNSAEFNGLDVSKGFEGIINKIEEIEKDKFKNELTNGLYFLHKNGYFGHTNCSLHPFIYSPSLIYNFNNSI